MSFGFAFIIVTNPLGVMFWYAIFECGTSLRTKSLRRYVIYLPKQKGGKPSCLFEH